MYSTPISIRRSIHCFAQQVVKIGLAKARADAGHDFVVQAVLQAGHRRREHASLSASFVADDLRTFDADQGRHVSAFAQTFGNLVGNEVAVGEDLKVDIRMGFEDVEQLLVHERFAAQQAKERVADFFWPNRIIRFIASTSILCCLAATSTQHPVQRRLQLLMIEM